MKWARIHDYAHIASQTWLDIWLFKDLMIIWKKILWYAINTVQNKAIWNRLKTRKIPPLQMIVDDRLCNCLVPNVFDVLLLDDYNWYIPFSYPHVCMDHFTEIGKPRDQITKYMTTRKYKK